MFPLEVIRCRDNTAVPPPVFPESRLFRRSLKAGFSAAVSDRAFKRSERPVYPHCIGNTVRLPALFGAITGAMSVGLISPDVLIAAAGFHFPSSGDRLISSIIVRNCSDSSSIKYRQHIAIPRKYRLRRTRLAISPLSYLLAL